MQRQVMEMEDEEENEDGEVVLQLYQMRRTWCDMGQFHQRVHICNSETRLVKFLMK
jgi:hypothetical protein